MLENQRKKRIIGLLTENTTMSTSELSKRLYVSDATVRRYLGDLERAGRIHRVHGGAELVSGEPAGWRCTTAGPITFNSLRNGEYYDARLEMAGWAENGFDDSTWQVPVPLAPPGGVLEEQTSPPCRVMRVIRPVALKRLSPTRAVADFGVNLSGWCRIRVRGKAGSAGRTVGTDLVSGKCFDVPSRPDGGDLLLTLSVGNNPLAVTFF